MYTNILHATDLSGNHFHMCQQATEIAQRFNATLYLLHVIETPPSLQLAQGLGFAEIDSPTQIQDDAKAVLAVLGESLNIPLDRQFVEIGAINQHVLAKLKELRCDMVIIGRHTPNHLPKLLGSTAHSIIHEANCDVLTLNLEQ
jgi:universal stress protein A